MVTTKDTGRVPASSSPPFAAHAIAALNGSPPVIDSVGQALMLCQRARDFLQAARTARQCGRQDLALRWLGAAEKLRIAAAAWRQRAREGS